MFCFWVAVGVDGGGIGGAVNDKTGVPDISMVTLVDFKRSHGRSWLTDNGQSWTCLFEDYRQCKKVVIFWKNETALKVCWLGVEKLVFFGYLEGGVWGQGHFDFHPMESGIAKV